MFQSRSPFRGCLRPSSLTHLMVKFGWNLMLIEQDWDWEPFTWVSRPPLLGGLRGGEAQNIPLLDIYLISLPSPCFTHLKNRAGHLTGNIWVKSTLKEQWDESFQLNWWHMLDWFHLVRRQSIACASNFLWTSNIFTCPKSSQGVIFVKFKCLTDFNCLSRCW